VYTNLVSPEILAEHLDDPAWVVVDCRFDLGNWSWGKSEYSRQHIPGAVYADLNLDLAAPVTPQTGRHPLPGEEALVQLFSRMGIVEKTQVVGYDQNGGAFAARLWWMLRSMQHSSVAVLDGGFPGWLALDLPTRSGIESRAPARFQGKLQQEKYVDADTVDQIRLDPGYRLIDARSAPRFLGEEELIDPVAGRIPGAVHRFHGDNLDKNGKLLPPGVLRQQFLDLLGSVPPQKAVVYCGSGVTSAHHLLAMDYAGLPGARLYTGSWSEWIRDPERPIATGANLS
jgi:thiosulfate/3-mercaptopyruvate sulfurtransferase